MIISLQKLVPIPLKEKFDKRTSGIWNVDKEFLPGEWIKIKAPSGTGKTTLMNILYKVRHDYEGNVFLDGKNLADIKGDELAWLRQQKVAVIFQDLRLFPNLTAIENIELNRVLQQPYCEKQRVGEMAEALNIHAILNQRAGICSYGEQQRIAIVRALVQPFEWLMMDEPFSHLDIENTKKAASLIEEECKKRNAGFILTDLDEDDNFNYTKRYTL
jgi:putative ABC transport system ATP-binding protein